MKKLYTYLMATIAFFGVVSCSDSASDDITPNTKGQEVNVTLRIAAAGNHTETRAAADANGITRASWNDKNATDDEMMKSWVIVVAENNTIKYILQDGYDSGEKEEDEVNVKLTSGTSYTLYSFANISLKDLGLENVTVGASTLPDGFANKTKTFAVSGNQDDVTKFTDGIPMSGLPVTWTPQNSNDTKDLEVIRMVAKVGIQFTNATSEDITVKSVSLTDITDNASDNANLNLFPTVNEYTENNVKTDSVAPALVNGVTKSSRSYTIPTGKQTITKGDTATGWEDSKETFTFYVNESEADVPHYFQLTVETSSGQKKFAFLDWKSISRNDYIRIPVVLNDYYIDWKVEGFTAIGVLPSITKTDNELTIKSKSYGEFHIIPVLYKNSITDSNMLTYGDNDGNWKVNTSATTDGTPYGWQSIEMNPSGGVGTNIFDVEPTWNATTHKIDGLIGNRAGYAIYQLAVTIGGATIPYRVEIIKE